MAPRRAALNSKLVPTFRVNRSHFSGFGPALFCVQDQLCFAFRMCANWLPEGTVYDTRDSIFGWTYFSLGCMLSFVKGQSRPATLCNKMKFKMPARATKREYPETGKTVLRVWGVTNGYSDKSKERSEVVIELAGEIELIVDVDELARILGCRALVSKGGKAVEAGGLVSARVLSRVEVSRKETAPRALNAQESYI